MNLAAGILAFGVAFWYLAGAAIFLVFMWLIPYSIWSASRSLKRIAESLDRITGVSSGVGGASRSAGAGPLRLS